MNHQLALVLRVHLYDGRYHGLPEWPPAPGRLFQALVAGGAPDLTGAPEQALRWLEGLDAPIVGAPSANRGQPVHFYVPNNDLDSVGGDPEEIAKLRVQKLVQPYLFDPALPLLYAWSFDPADEAPAHALCALSERLYQLGRGVDMAYARASILDREALDELLARYPGRVYRPTPGAVGHELVLSVPMQGSYDSLATRFEANSRRFILEGSGRKAIEVFVQPPKPRFARIPYDAPAAHGLFELRLGDDLERFAPTALSGISPLVERVRDAAAARLTEALPEQAADIERSLIGRSVEGVGVSKEQRIRIIPLPSIGHTYADRAVRRVLVEVPAGGPLRTEDVFWAFSGLGLPGAPETVLVRAADLGMLEYYGIRSPARDWRTVTAAALPEATRRRIEPTRKAEEAKGGPERAEEERRAVFAVSQALRHAGLSVPLERVRVQREPFDARGERAEAFAKETRFPKERLWHVEITFAEPVAGPLVLGDGRFLGLGVMAPGEPADAVFAFTVRSGLTGRGDPLEIADALRRAVMARVQETFGKEALPPFFSGHGDDGAPARGEPHLLFVFDAERARLLVVAPHLAERRHPSVAERRHLARLSGALAGLRELRAGRAGKLLLQPTLVDLDSDPLFAPSTVWESQTTYQVTRHTKKTGADEALAADLRTECLRRGLPEPTVTPLGLKGIPGVGLVGGARLTFASAVAGPLVLGRSRHRGGGLFAGAGDP